MAKHQQTVRDARSSLEVVVLAAGQGTRMRSALPKVLHTLAGRPLLCHVLETAGSLNPRNIHVVVGYEAPAVKAAVVSPVTWVDQEERLGTGHAVSRALPGIEDSATVLVVYGDVPLITPETLARAVLAADTGSLALVTAEFSDPAELGRIRRDGAGVIVSIVEFADASDEERRICEINSGILALNAATMKQLLAQVEPRNAQGEYYLTDLVALAVQHNISVIGVNAAYPEEVAGVNDRMQLAQLERHYQRDAAERLMAAGVTIADPNRLDVRGHVSAGEDCFLDVNVVLEGTVVLGRGVVVGAGSVIRDSKLGDDVRIEPHTVIEGATIARRCQLGPFARIRPGTDLHEAVKIGNFVEVKKSTVGRGTKASHLTYLGDTTLGENCNVGAGTVTCNYDGAEKHPTIIGDRVFVGTNATLVAPLEIAADAFIAAGSTITSGVGEGELGVGRGKQRNVQGWTPPGGRKKAPENNEGT
jgi:bifunctional UDP-N-acetylglucosamine pyrophosphorylase/glucosamine-1-phosphate N-acetyltransferase